MAATKTTCLECWCFPLGSALPFLGRIGVTTCDIESSQPLSLLPPVLHKLNLLRLEFASLHGRSGAVQLHNFHRADLQCATQTCLTDVIVWPARPCTLAGVLASCANESCLAIARSERVDVTSDGRKKPAYEVQGLQQNHLD